MSTGGLVLVGGRAPSVSVSGHPPATLGPRHGFAYTQPRSAEGELLPHPDSFSPSFDKTWTRSQGQGHTQTADQDSLPHSQIFRGYTSPGFQDTFAKQATKLMSEKPEIPKKVREEVEREARKKRGPPLLWSPPPPDPEKVRHCLALASQQHQRSQRFQSAAGKWRVRHTTPTFVDESLFGQKLEEPAFRPPWEDVKPVDRSRPWTPSLALESQRHSQRQGKASQPRRPRSASASLRRSQSQDLSISQTRPVWKP